MADFLLGRPSSYSQSTAFDKNDYSPLHTIFLQDDLRMNRLTLNLGLRYDLSVSLPQLRQLDGGARYLLKGLGMFGSMPLALAAYNAGDSRVIRWQQEKPGLPQDEFIDDIPFPETHVMEHGLYVLEGKGVYLLNQDWVEVQAGDFMWLRAFCPQACYAGGPGPFRYLLYKDVYRDGF